MDVIRDWWQVALGLLAGVAWLIRLETRTQVLERDLKRMDNETKEMLREIRDDIKDLIKRTA